MGSLGRVGAVVLTEPRSVRTTAERGKMNDSGETGMSSGVSQA